MTSRGSFFGSKPSLNNPEEFRVRKQVLRKGVAYLFRYREVSWQANGRYLDALAVVDDPTNAKRDRDRVTPPKKDAAGRLRFQPARTP